MMAEEPTQRRRKSTDLEERIERLEAEIISLRRVACEFAEALHSRGLMAPGQSVIISKELGGSRGPGH